MGITSGQFFFCFELLSILLRIYFFLFLGACIQFLPASKREFLTRALSSSPWEGFSWYRLKRIDYLVQTAFSPWRSAVYIKGRGNLLTRRVRAALCLCWGWCAVPQQPTLKLSLGKQTNPKHDLIQIVLWIFWTISWKWGGYYVNKQL